MKPPIKVQNTVPVPTHMKLWFETGIPQPLLQQADDIARTFDVIGPAAQRGSVLSNAIGLGLARSPLDRPCYTCLGMLLHSLPTRRMNSAKAVGVCRAGAQG